MSCPHRNAVRRSIRPASARWLLALGLSLQAGLATAASFDITGASTTAQTLGSGSGQTGLVREGASLTVSGSTVAVTVSGANATLTNLGSIVQTGTGRAIRDNTGVTNLVVVNGSATNSTAAIRTQDADLIQMNRSPASVTLTNWGSMVSTNASAGGNQVIDFNAIAAGSNVVNNQAGALMLAYEADSVRPGVGGIVNNAGTIRSITATGSSSDGIDFQTNAGITVNNLAGGLVDGARHGITGGPDLATTSWAAAVNNAAGATIRGMNGAGLNFDGFNGLQLVTVQNAGSIIGNGITGDGDGVDIDGLVDLTNSGTIRSVNAVSASGLAFSEAISVGGGSIRNTGLIEGLVAAGNGNAVGRGISLVGNDITSGTFAGQREALYGDASVVNGAGGIIRGASDSAIYIGGLRGSGRLVNVQNQAGGSIVGGGSAAAVLSASDYDTTLVNAGRIDGSASGLAVDLGAGRNLLVISGGQAVVLGDMRGTTVAGDGTAALRFELGAGNSFSYGGALINFNSVQLASGRVVLSGTSQNIGAVTLNGGTLVLQGAGRLGAAGALTLAGGGLQASGGNQTFASLALLDSASVLLDGAGLSFGTVASVAAGKTLAVTQTGAATYSLRFSGDQTQNGAFLALVAATTVNGQAAAASFDGGFTTLSAVPEPGSVLLLLAGLAALVLAQSPLRRRVQAAARSPR